FNYVWVVLVIVIVGGTLAYFLNQGILFPRKVEVEAPEVEEVKAEEPSPLPPATEEEAEKEVATEEEVLAGPVQEEVKEFTPELIKNRLYDGSRELPLWLFEEWGHDKTEYIVSGVVVESIKFNQGELKEIVVPVAFQNPTTEEFFIRDLSVGASESFINGVGMIDLTNWQFLKKSSTGDYGNYTAYIIDSQSLAGRLRPGDQIAFTLMISEKRLEEEKKMFPKDWEKCEEDPYCSKMIKESVPNNLAIVEAMQENKDLPEVIIYPLQFFVNKEPSSEPSLPPQETISPAVEEEIEEIIKEVLAEPVQEEVKEFTPEMIKNRLFRGGKELPIWYLMEWGDEEYVASAVIAGPPKFDQELKKILVPVAFQNPKSKEFFVRDLFLLGPPLAPFALNTIFLTDWQFPVEWKEWTEFGCNAPELLEYFQPGDQIAFTLVTSLEIWKTIPESQKTPDWQLDVSITEKFLSNHLALFEAMKKNKDLPEVVLLPHKFFVNGESCY
ncbi:hypothetical protein HKBW3S25_01140, partial [Candidatus Hakubella thermalkaliphila]